MRAKMTTERWKRHDYTRKEDTFLWNLHLCEQRAQNWLIPKGQTAPCDLQKPRRVLGISQQSGGGGEEKEEKA